MDNTKKLNFKNMFIWLTNIVLFVSVIYMGILQAGLGAEVSKLEDEIQLTLDLKHELSETILLANSTTKLSQKSRDLGFLEPSNVIYIDSKESFVSLLPQ